MSTTKKALFLIGSPKSNSKSSSWHIADSLIKAMAVNGVESKVLRLISLVGSSKSERELLDAISDCDVLIFSSPVYNGVPSFVIRVMDAIKNNRANIRGRKEIFVISNCGIPRAEQNNTAINIYRQFAKEMGFIWLGAFAICMGPIIIFCGGIIRKMFGWNMNKAIASAACDISMGRPVSERAKELMSRPIMPVWLYTWKHSAEVFFIAKLIAWINNKGKI